MQNSDLSIGCVLLLTVGANNHPQKRQFFFYSLLLLFFFNEIKNIESVVDFFEIQARRPVLMMHPRTDAVLQFLVAPFEFSIFCRSVLYDASDATYSLSFNLLKKPSLKNHLAYSVHIHDI